MRKIGLIGFFNTGAFSDDIIEYTTKSLLSKYMDNLVFDSNVLWKCGNGTKPEYLNSFDLIVHCGGSLLGKCTHPPLRDINLWIDKVSTPIAVFGCFPAGTMVFSTSPIISKSKRWFSGKVYTIYTKNGKLTCTPHHPILTENGWIVAKNLKVGNPLFRMVNANTVMDGKRNKTSLRKISYNKPNRIGTYFQTEDFFHQIQSKQFGNNQNGQKRYACHSSETSNGLHKNGMALSCGSGRRRRIFMFPQTNIEKSWTRSTNNAIFTNFQHLSESNGMVENENGVKLLLQREIDDWKTMLCVCDERINITASFEEVIEILNNQEAKLRSYDRVYTEPIEENSFCPTRQTRTRDSNDCLRIEPEKILFIKTNFFNGFVYNRETADNMYFANGFLVHNSGYRYEKDKEPLKPEMRERMNLLFKKAEVVSLRGERSMAHCKENGIDISKVSSLGDPAIACDMMPAKSGLYIGGNVRDPQAEEVQHVPKQTTQKLMAQIYDWLIETYDLPLELISFRHNYDFDNDVEGAKQTITLMKHHDKASIFKPQTFQEAFSAVAKSVFWFGQRLHPSIFASIQDIPFVGLEYQFEKMMDWMSTVKSSNYIWSNQTLDEFMMKWDNVPKEMENIKRYTILRRKDICLTAQRIMRLIGGG